MTNLRSLPLGVILSMIDNTLDDIYNSEYDYNYSKNKEILEAAYKTVENKRKRIQALKSIIRIV